MISFCLYFLMCLKTLHHGISYVYNTYEVHCPGETIVKLIVSHSQHASDLLLYWYIVTEVNSPGTQLFSRCSGWSKTWVEGYITGNSSGRLRWPSFRCEFPQKHMAGNKWGHFTPNTDLLILSALTRARHALCKIVLFWLINMVQPKNIFEKARFV